MGDPFLHHFHLKYNKITNLHPHTLDYLSCGAPQKITIHNVHCLAYNTTYLCLFQPFSFKFWLKNDNKTSLFFFFLAIKGSFGISNVKLCFIYPKVSMRTILITKLFFVLNISLVFFYSEMASVLQICLSKNKHFADKVTIQFNNLFACCFKLKLSTSINQC